MAEPTYEVGEFYMVECLERDGAWFPILGKPHSDPELLPGNTQRYKRHVHLDFRFMSKWLTSRLYRPDPTSVLWERDGEGFRLAFRKKKCVRVEHATFPACFHNGEVAAPFYNALYAQLSGKRINPERPVCPHKGISLAGVSPDEDGCLVCPGHGARWDAATGELRPRPEWGDWRPDCMKEVAHA